MDISSFATSLDRMKESFLLAAAQGGNLQDCDSLIELGADVNWRGLDGGDTPLLAACRRGHAETVQFLLAHGADSNTIGSDSLSALHIVAQRNDIATLNVLLESNVSLRTTTKGIIQLRYLFPLLFNLCSNLFLCHHHLVFPAVSFNLFRTFIFLSYHFIHRKYQSIH